MARKDFFADKVFRLTDQHIALLRRAIVQWHDCEFGAPEIDPKRPYGNSSVIVDIAKILGVEPDTTTSWGDRGWKPETQDALREIHRETMQALQVLLCTGEMKPGLYHASWTGRDWRRIEEPLK